MTKIALLGGGSWGTALAIVLSRSSAAHRLSLWVHDPALAKTMRARRSNDTYLPGFVIPAGVEISNSMPEVLEGAQIVFGVMPAANARSVYTQALPSLVPETVFVSATKGLEPSTHARMSEVLSQVLAGKFSPRFSVLSGPSFALETARGDPTAVVIAAEDAALAIALQKECAGKTFRLYTNSDPLGVELAGAMKNVIAIAAGACEGVGLGQNSTAALITRGLAEMTRLAVALGGRPETFSGLAGLGDLVLTCTGALSRNRFVGVELGRGRRLPQILAGMRQVAEGVGTATALFDLARAAGVEMPISRQVFAILNEEKSALEAIRETMDRPLKRE
ncbi:MAG: NAD(P)H-dependent glycerol-3-phosphate dehydrogenase [Candidatus Acidiferrales bacterium]|jgi:glycerol-3-phosphate dehydrogenase (NAD(P)+)